MAKELIVSRSDITTATKYELAQQVASRDDDWKHISAALEQLEELGGIAPTFWCEGQRNKLASKALTLLKDAAYSDDDMVDVFKQLIEANPFPFEMQDVIALVSGLVKERKARTTGGISANKKRRETLIEITHVMFRRLAPSDPYMLLCSLFKLDPQPESLGYPEVPKDESAGDNDDRKPVTSA